MSAMRSVATRGLQSARREPQGAWRGYALRFTAWADWPDEDCAYPGAQVDALGDHLQECLQPLVDVALHEVLPDASDAALLRFVAQRWAQTAAPTWSRLHVRSTESAGADLSADGVVLLWRRYRLRCAHYLPHVPMGHKCGRLHGHDFDVVVHARWDEQVPDHDALDALWAPWHMRLNYQQLNGMQGLENPTSENLSSWLWHGLRADIPGLSGVTVFETASCGAHFDGVEYRIWKDFSFDSATRHACAPPDQPQARVHGHTYQLRLVLQAPLDAYMGWLVDFGDVKRAFAPVFDSVDHRPLFECPQLERGDAAVIAGFIHEQARGVLPMVERTVVLDPEGGGCEVAPVDRFLPLPP